MEFGAQRQKGQEPPCAQGRPGKEALPTWRVLGPWQQIERGLALPGTGLAEASLGLERRIWVGAGAGGWGQRNHPQVSLGQ